MHCLMFGLGCDKEQFDRYISLHNNPYSVAHFLFEVKLIENLEKKYDIAHNYIYQSNSKKDQNRWVEPRAANITKNTKTTWISYRNSKILKFLSIYFSVKRVIEKFYNRYGNDFFILSTINFMPVAYATQVMAKKLGIKNFIIFTDCTESFAYDGGDNPVKKALKKIYKRIVAHLEHGYDAYINFSPAMDRLVNPHNRPSVVMEGFFNSDNLDFKSVEKYDKFVILFAGSLLPTMGIQNMILAFKQVQSNDAELWIAGDGPAKKELMELATDDGRIKFIGFIDRNKLFKIEKKAHLLINTRNPDDLFTKYSFPSKTFEYLASGTPFLSTRLECYLGEYNDYIIFINDNRVETISEKLIDILCWEEKKLASYGEAAKSFVSLKKDDITQCQKVIDFIEDILLD